MSGPGDPADGGTDRPPEFGPRGYVPPQAAKRARKIVLREPMGLGWPVAAVVAGVLLVLLGVVFLLTRTGPPGAPFEPVAEVADVDPRGAVVVPAGSGEVLIVRAGGPVRAFAAPGSEVAYCRASRRLESDAGTVWSVDGRHLGGPGRSLTPLPSQVHDGTLYVNVTEPLTAPPAATVGAEPAC